MKPSRTLSIAVCATLLSMGFTTMPYDARAEHLLFGPIKVTPPSPNFKSVLIGKFKVIELTLRNVCKGKERDGLDCVGVTISSASFPVADPQVFGIVDSQSTCDIGTVLGQGQSCTLAAGFAPTTDGPRSDVLTIEYDSVEPSVVQVRGKGK
jgi:hypothetical protein